MKHEKYLLLYYEEVQLAINAANEKKNSVIMNFLTLTFYHRF